MFRRGMSALANPDGPASRPGFDAGVAHPALIPPDAPSRRKLDMQVHHGQREILVPARPVGGPARAIPLEEHPSNPWDVVANPVSPSQRRQVVQVALGGLAVMFFAAGFLTARSQMWTLSILFVMIFLGYLALKHEMSRREETSVRAKRMQAIKSPQAVSSQRLSSSSSRRRRPGADGVAAQSAESSDAATSRRRSLGSKSSVRPVSESSALRRRSARTRSDEQRPARARGSRGSSSASRLARNGEIRVTQSARTAELRSAQSRTARR